MGRGIRQFVKDVDGDWLDDWGDTIDTKNSCLSYINLETLILETFLYLSVLNLLFITVLTSSQEVHAITTRDMAMYL
ncbi:hypothetical protein WA1_41640 [Scytonema hofmannii PCC 7110]|uniref:Uncharacterized protein n=1 Tax=Scytonema hofmannii PCC 7110 TaxID=128403 RepID=A0A139WV16_9CYAN|nr:hypothetical protein WA1_41640 [Scytonema hofmannii PCC 7110]